MTKIVAILCLIVFTFCNFSLAQKPKTKTVINKKDPKNKGKKEVVIEEKKDTSPPEKFKLIKLVKNTKVAYGGFADVYAGWTFGMFGDLEKSFTPEKSLGEDYEISSLGSSKGANAHVLLFKSIILTGGANYLSYNAAGTKKGQTTLNVNQIGGNIGYAIINKNQWLLYPYVGFWAGKAKLRLSNFNNDSISFGDKLWIQRSDFREFEATGNVIELGLGGRYLKSKKGGIMVGAELGFYMNSGKSDWTNLKTNTTVSSVEKLGITGVYLRFTLGGGFFTYNAPDSDKDKPKEIK